VPELQNGWRNFLQKRREAKATEEKKEGQTALGVAKRRGNANSRKAALDRLCRKSPR